MRRQTSSALMVLVLILVGASTVADRLGFHIRSQVLWTVGLFGIGLLAESIINHTYSPNTRNWLRFAAVIVGLVFYAILTSWK